jgi:UDP-N-acetylenolpyruvoylglucosamine reductase
MGCGEALRAVGELGPQVRLCAGGKGGAQVSTKHADFTINAAGAGDIVRLIERVQAQVEGTSGVRLLPEVRRV